MSRAAYMRDYRAKRAASLSDGGLLPFQKRFVDALTRKQAAPEIGILGSPRAQGKSWLCGRLIGRSLTPGDVLHEEFGRKCPGRFKSISSLDHSGICSTGIGRRARNQVVERWCNPRGKQARIKIISSDARRLARPGRTREVAVL